MPESPVMVLTTLPGLMSAAQIESSPAFVQLLGAHELHLEHRAPPSLRALLQGREIVRMGAREGYRHHEDRHTWTWWASEIGFVGTPEQVSAHLTGVLRAAGFSRQPSAGYPGRVVRRETADFTEELLVDGPSPWTGTQRAVCGVELGGSVCSRATSPALTLAGVCAALPILVDPDVDPRLFAELAQVQVKSITLGGPWTQFYTLSVTFQPPSTNPAGATQLHTRLDRLIGEIGFTREARQPSDGRHLRYCHQREQAFAQLYAPDENGLIRLHYQPRA